MLILSRREGEELIILLSIFADLTFTFTISGARSAGARPPNAQ